MAKIRLKKDPWAKGVPPEVKVTKAGFDATDDLTNYKDFILEQVGNPSTLLTRKGLKARVDAAHEAYLQALYNEVAKKA